MPAKFCGMHGDFSVAQGLCGIGALRGMIKLLVGGQQGLALLKQQKDCFGLLRHIRENAHSFIVAPFAHDDEVIRR